jgi:hypothetical protein
MGEGVAAQRVTAMVLGILLCVPLTLLSGCVVPEEKYTAEKGRSLNFQRLLAEEERRREKFDSETKRSKQELLESEVRHRELSAQMRAVQEHMARLKQEAEEIKKSTVLERNAMEKKRKGGSGSAKKKQPATQEPVTDLRSFDGREKG